MNSAFLYPHYDSWDKALRPGSQTPLEKLMLFISQEEGGADMPADDSLYKDRGVEAEYSNKTFGYNVKALIDYWDSQGIHYECREMGGTRWVSMVPLSAYQDRENRIPAIFVIHRENYQDKYWAMHTVMAYADVVSAAAKDNMAVIFLTGAVPGVYEYRGAVNEAQDLFPVDTKRIWLDVSVLERNGKSPSDFGLDAEVKSIGSAGIPAISMDGYWQKRGDAWLFMINSSSADIDKERIYHSEQGRVIAQTAAIQFDYDGPQDPALLKRFCDMGVVCQEHDYKGHRWVSFTPAQNDSGPLPVILLFQEVNYSNDYLLNTAYASFYQYIELAAEGEAALLIFARESSDNNQMFVDILAEAEKMYSLDRSRVYATGHSHNGNFALEFTRRNPDLVTAAAILGNLPGLPHPSDCIIPVPFTDDMVEDLIRSYNPISVISGLCEMGCMFPVGRFADNVAPGYSCQLTDNAGRIRSWQRRLRSCCVEEPTAEEVAAAADSEDLAVAKLGVPCDKTGVVHLYGFDHYIADFNNRDGKLALRLIGIENMSHMPVPSMLVMAWDFMRRFYRNESGDVVAAF